MNKKGFAISVVLYAVIFVVIAIFYLLLGIIRSRYSVNNGLKNNILSELNSGGHLFTKLNNDDPVNILIVNPNGGSVDIDGLTVTKTTRVVKYAGETVELKNATNNNQEDMQSFYTVTYDADGGDTTPPVQTSVNTNTTSYNFGQWNDTGSCGDFLDDAYTFPSEYGTICTKTIEWSESNHVSFDSQIELAAAITKPHSIFMGWKSSINNQIYPAESTYDLTQNVVMTAEWREDVWAIDLGYDDSLNNMGCDNVKCALDKIKDILKRTGNF